MGLDLELHLPMTEEEFEKPDYVEFKDEYKVAAVDSICTSHPEILTNGSELWN